MFGAHLASSHTAEGTVRPISGSSAAISGNAGNTNAPQSKVPSHYDETRKANMKLGRVWASKVRRLVKNNSIDRYAAFQLLADKSARPVTDIKRLVELHNKTAKEKAKSMRQNLVWLKHLQGMNDKEIASSLKIHPKTVASDRREMKQRQLGGAQNDR